ncbi:unnamed protein product [Closterium sp. Yama58-4]|nr:unnamed protein product [Closterium sp. Yama58-4]
MTQFACCYHVFTNYVMDVTMCMGPSMLPTLNAAGDVVLLEHITPALHALKPGDIVVAKSPSNPRMVVCKRIVAMEGHEVHAMPPTAATRGVMFGGRGRQSETHTVVRSRGAIVLNTPSCQVSPSNPRMRVCKRVVAMEGHEVHAMSPPPRGMVIGGRSKHTETLTVVPRGHVWLQGDNLFNSTDSRHYGPVPLALVKGRVFYRVSERE